MGLGLTLGGFGVGLELICVESAARKTLPLGLLLGCGYVSFGLV